MHEILEVDGCLRVRISLPDMERAAEIQLNLDPQRLHLVAEESGCSLLPSK